MRFKNKLIKLYIRYAKESGQYRKFKDCLERYIRRPHFGKIDNTSIDKFFGAYNSDLYFMTTIGFHDGPKYDDCGEKYVFNLYRDEIIQEFYNFINENDIGPFFDKIDFFFIDKNISIHSDFDIMVPVSNEDKEKFLFEYLTPSSFIVASFAWDGTDEGFSFWDNIHEKWIFRYRDLLNKLIN